MILRRCIVLSLVALAAVSHARSVRIGVLGLFHPNRLIVQPAGSGAIVLHIDSETYTLDPTFPGSEAVIETSPTFVTVQIAAHIFRGEGLTVSDRSGNACEFVLKVPGKISRHYKGVLGIKQSEGALVAEIRMDLETAVASIVAAENTADVPLEAAKAQAIAARSFLVAGSGRHREFDFCDTTHCQFLRNPPGPESTAAKAADLTRSLILTYRSRPVAAMYSRSCGGRTRTPADLGMTAADYPYHEVECAYCRRHPEYWEARVTAEDAELLRESREASRLQVSRRLGWNTVPSTNLAFSDQGSDVLVTGIGRGHGIGLCQLGAMGMARQGSTATEILQHYYPDTEIRTLQQVQRTSP